jgi:predicted MPP superfamily phosphohydrolase
MSDLQGWFFGVAIVTAVGIPLYAWRQRGRQYAIFAGVLLAFSLPGALALHGRLSEWLPAATDGWLDLLFAGGMASTALQLAHLTNARLRGPVFRWLVSVPGQTFLANGFLSGIWLVTLWPIRLVLGAAFGEAAVRATDWFDLAPVALCLASIVTSMRLVHDVARVRLGRAGPDELQRIPVERHRRKPRPLREPVLRVVQISDPHLGPWQSVGELQRTIRRLLAHEPDLVLLTGDFLTMEGRGTPQALGEALAPLADYQDRCYAIYGNHDHEDPELVANALTKNGVDLLIDEERVIDTPIGRLQLLGADYRGRDRKEHLEELLQRFPRRHDHTRLLLLHDPLTFQHVPAGDVDLTLSGHTHGGQVGLLSLGLDWTVLSKSRWPDHGLFARGASRLYVHRGTGFYGFPLRIGVPGEASLLEIAL